MTAAASLSRRIGLIVNPIAGMGGKVGLRGTDGSWRQQRARELGATEMAAERAGIALDRLREQGDLALTVAGGAMGEKVAREHGFEAEVAGEFGCETSPEDTREAALAMADSGVELILFAGGDGTARVIRESIGRRVPVVGIPTGVKMHSGCFARSPAAAADVVVDYLGQDPGTARLGEADVVDRDADDPSATTTLYGTLTVPEARSRLLAAKSQSAGRDAAAMRSACLEVVEEMRPDELYVIGPGSTMSWVRRHLGFESDPLAIDVVRDRELLAGDVNEAELDRLTAGAGRVNLVMGVIGGQGSLLGRGNQQIGPGTLRRVDPDDLIVVADLQKLIELGSSPLTVDTGDPEIDRHFTGYRPVRIGRNESLIYQVAA
ncbi:MAG: NAD(+)/NADH kinase [Solirubrobacterales bacterium]|nr:NAD(+)/NADH kinase [Solirubrobacterales bacterium]